MYLHFELYQKISGSKKMLNYDKYFQGRTHLFSVLDILLVFIPTEHFFPTFVGDKKAIGCIRMQWKSSVGNARAQPIKPSQNKINSMSLAPELLPKPQEILAPFIKGLKATMLGIIHILPFPFHTPCLLFPFHIPWWLMTSSPIWITSTINKHIHQRTWPR